jgi:hypothetical protein
MTRMLVCLVLLALAPLSRAGAAITCTLEGETKDISSVSLCNALAKRLARPLRVADHPHTTGEAVHFIRGDVYWTVLWLAEGRTRAWARLSHRDLGKKLRASLVQTAAVLATTRACGADEHDERCKTSEVLDAYPESQRTTPRRVFVRR